MRHREPRDMRHQFLALAGPRPVLAARRRRVAFADLHQHRPVGQPARRARSFRDRIDHDLGVQAAGDDHRTAAQKHRPVARAAPQHQPVPARRPFIREQRFAHPRMNAVGADQDIAAHGLGVRAGAIEEIRRDAALVLGEGPRACSRYGSRHARAAPRRRDGSRSAAGRDESRIAERRGRHRCRGIRARLPGHGD